VPKLWPHRRKTVIGTAEIELIGYKKYLVNAPCGSGIKEKEKGKIQP
jgi:hypothetical protein